ncbi:MAG TPA: anti-sigma regulatory factor [Dehalococcoidales bacterium]
MANNTGAPVKSGSEIKIAIRSDVDVVIARQEGRRLAAGLGFSISELTLIATAISEVARNIVNYAGHGEIILNLVEEPGRKGISIIAQDKGPGIPDIALAMQDGYSTSKGLGLGLPGSKRIVDDFEIVSEVGKGTTVRMRKWKRQNAISQRG